MTPATPATPVTLDWTDRVLDVEVGPVAHGGHCVARHEGRVLFVRHSLPGERVRAVVTDDQGGSFALADAISVLEPSPDRVAAPCTWARAGGCGGCDFQHVEPAAQRDLKTTVLREQLSRLGGVESDVVVEELPGGPLGWRQRLRLAVDDAGRAGLRAHHSHEVVPVADCLLAPSGMLPDLLEQRWPPNGHLEVAVDATGERRLGSASVQHAAGRDWELSPGAFWQVHPELADTLADVVRDWAAAPRGGVAWDLYGGVGLFAAVLAAQVGPQGSVTVVEASTQAVADGRRALADLRQVDFRAGRVERVIAGLPDPAVVVADPPRKGLQKRMVTEITERAPERVVYVACDPAALGRDVRLFRERGYGLTRIRSFDAFPMTHHMESVALFETL
ncbi:23S rRNA m(5)U-1939 methyltransferase [Pseudonocardia oroxyli]|uniref:23S rRNA m(5)U-1939 methyltransferase n=1 Tax=Pseudonocardia oroxyli TaxID=366584 RepID=A0A1G7YNS0_PSEOR|nr:23S rRNA m(5)U-1939 methyltransferase [Pseudonocardia oroxyli]